jgi:hypothetical protein
MLIEMISRYQGNFYLDPDYESVRNSTPVILTYSQVEQSFLTSFDRLHLLTQEELLCPFSHL